MRVKSLGYVGINSPDPSEWLRFGTDILGLSASEKRGDADVYLRMDDRDWRFAIHRAEKPGLAYVGWELRNVGEFESGVAQLEQAGFAVKVADRDEARERSVQGLARLTAPGGHETELFYGQVYRRGFVSQHGIRFVTGDYGLGHVVLTVPEPEYDEAERFYRAMLGFGVSEYLSFENLRGALLHCGPRHHTLGLVGAGKRPGCDHIMLEASEYDDVGRCWDRCNAANVPIRLSLGRHSDDHMFSFYLTTPSRFGLEFGAGGRLIDPVTWSSLTLLSSTDGDFWGHHASGPAS